MSSQPIPNAANSKTYCSDLGFLARLVFTLVFAAVPNEKKGLLSFFRRIGVKPGEEATPLSPEDFARIAAEHDLILRPPDSDE